MWEAIKKAWGDMLVPAKVKEVCTTVRSRLEKEVAADEKYFL